MQRKITILGGGNGARTAAAEISLLGHQVTLYEIESLVSHVAAIKEAGFIEAFGSIQGRAPINVELNLKKAVGGSELILVIVPTMYQINYARLLAPLLQKGQSVALMPGSLGALEFRAELDRLGGEREITIGEFAALPYATRIHSPVSVHVFGRRRYVSAGIFPASETTRVMPVYEDIYPGFHPEHGIYDAWDARKLAYWALFAGAHGHTYGANGVFQFSDGKRPDIFRASKTWQEALAVPGATQMGYARRLLESRPFLDRIPDQRLLVSASGLGADHVQATRAADGGYALDFKASGSPSKTGAPCS